MFRQYAKNINSVSDFVDAAKDIHREVALAQFSIAVPFGLIILLRDIKCDTAEFSKATC